MKIHTFVLPEPFSVGSVNVYLLETDRLTLIDCGPRDPATLELLMQKFTELGLELCNLDKVLLTHSHLDHAGLSHVITKCSKGRVYLHPSEFGGFESLKKPLMEAARFKYLFHKAGLDECKIWQLYLSYQDLYNQAKTRYYWLDDGQQIDIGLGMTLEVVHTPGHTLGHVCFWYEKERLLFSGDAILAKVSPITSLEVDEKGKRIPMFNKYFYSLERLAQLRPNLIYPGHGKIIDNFEELIRTSKTMLEQRKAKIKALFAGKRLRVYDVAKLIYPDTKGLDTLLAVAKIWGLLDLLEADGAIIKEVSNEVEFFSLG